MATLPQGWKQGNKPNIYEANIKAVTVSRRTDYILAETNKSDGSYTVYTTSGANFSGGRSPLYTVSSSGTRTIQNQTIYNQLQQSGEISKLDAGIKPKAFEINQAFGTEEEKRAVSNSSLYKSQANAVRPGTATSTSQAASDIEREAGTSNANTRKTYDILQYPLDLRLENQDCIKFSIVEYIPPKLNPNSPNTSFAGSRIVQLNGEQFKRPKIGQRKILGTITLPIPAGIGDRNSADWQEDRLSSIQQAFTDISLQTIVGGGEAGTQAAQSNLNAATADGGQGLTQLVSAKMAEAATGASNILARQFGAVANPNLELLFNGPSLRSFTFNFKFTPRQRSEAESVRKIIRQFKQAMSVKRSSSSLLLKSPHTFAISYLSKNINHPYLNRFKECALIDCSVNYTPDGTYMTYTDSSMTSYELSLTFQELEPIFDDEYFEIDKNADNSIGF